MDKLAKTKRESHNYRDFNTHSVNQQIDGKLVKTLNI